MTTTSIISTFRMENPLRKPISFEIVAAFVTWLTLLGLTIYSMLQISKVSGIELAFAVGLMVIFIVSFLYSTSESAQQRQRLCQGHVVLQIVVVITLYFVLPVSYMPILATIWCTQLPRLTGFKWSVAIAGLVCIPIYFALAFYWHNGNGVVSALVFWMFNVFALVTMDRAVKEEQAKEKANALNRELIATQSLLSEATRQSERLRISRNIHDVVGHHLTALTINLQVASHLSSGKAKATIDQCHSVAKLLLSDVREAVSEMREKSAIDLPAALGRVFEQSPGIDTRLDVAAELNINEVAVAEVIVRAVQEALTNALKHSNCQHLWVSLTSENEQLHLNIKNDGCNSTSVEPGNGLEGMGERVSGLGGHIDCRAEPPYFAIDIYCPSSL